MTVELVFLLPVVLLLVLSVGQVVLILRAELLVTQAAREAARVASVSDGVATITAAAVGATGLDPASITVEVVARGQPGDLVTVRVTHSMSGTLPVVGRLVAGHEVSATATMLVED